MTEAHGSWNAYYKAPSGNKEQFTLRMVDLEPPDAYLARIDALAQALAKRGYEPYYQTMPEPATPAPQPQPAAANGAAPPPPDGEQFYFDVQSIKLAAGGDNPRWIVKGGKFTKYGVTCWPETLEAVNLVKHLDPFKENAPSGNWRAWYVMGTNQNGEPKADKVVRLERVG